MKYKYYTWLDYVYRYNAKAQLGRQFEFWVSEHLAWRRSARKGFELDVIEIGEIEARLRLI